MSAITSTVWSDVLGHLKFNSPQLMRGWFVGLRPGVLEGGVLRVCAANAAPVPSDAPCNQPFTT